MSDPVAPQPPWQLFALGSAFFAAVTAILGKLGVREINSNLAALIQTTTVLVLILAAVTVRGQWEPLSNLSGRGVGILLLSGVATGLSWLCYYRALQLAPASQVSPIDKASVALVIVFAVLVLGEPLTWKLAVGGGLVTAGVLVLAR